MKTITIWLMKYQLHKARKYKDTLAIVSLIDAYNVLINNYESTILFLKATK